MIPAIFRRWLNLLVTLCTDKKGLLASSFRCGARSYSIAKQAVRTIGTMSPSEQKVTLRYAHSLSLLAAVLLLAVAMPAVAQPIDYDADDNRLIEIRTLAQLNAIRWDLNGDGSLDTLTTSADTMAYRAAFLNAVSGMGCPSTGCIGYELMTDLDFDENNDDEITATDPTYWNSGSGWMPIGSGTARFNATFDGDGHVIENLFINRSSTNAVGLFGATDKRARILALGLVNVSVGGALHTGALVGLNVGRIAAVYASGAVQGISSVGGLVGVTSTASSVIVASYSTASVTITEVRSHVGLTKGAGLVGWNDIYSVIRASYSTGAVTGGHSRGGFFRGPSVRAVAASYWDSERNGIEDDNDAAAPEGRTTLQLQSPTSATGIYAKWDSLDVNGDGTADEHPWTFGASDQYPVLKYAGMDTAAQFAAHSAAQFVPRVTLTAFEDSLVVRWNAVRNATGYKVQWKSGRERYPSADQTGSTHGQATVSGGSDTTYTIANLTMGMTYAVRVIATRTGYASDPSAEVMGVPGIRYDSDGDGLIEIETLAQLNAIRWDYDGDGAVATGARATGDTMGYNAAFPNAASSMGCPSSNCIGYELTVDLDFDENGDDEITAADPTYWNSGSGFTPICLGTLAFNATFDGNGHVIENLFINRSNTADVGLFGDTGTAARILALGLVNVSVRGARNTGALVGYNQGRIAAVYASGAVQGTDNVGGLVGRTASSVIVASYSTASVTIIGTHGAGAGLVGWNDINRVIRASYSTGTVTGGTARGGFFRGDGTVEASYWDSESSGINDDSDATAPEGKTTVQLRLPTSATGIYVDWDSLDVNGNGTADEHPWTFGASNQYPVLKYAGMDTTAQFAAQPPIPAMPQGVTLTPKADTLIVRWNAVSDVTGYKVQWKSDGHDYPSTDEQSSTRGQVSVPGESTTTYTIANLTNGTIYTVRVIATKTGEPDGPPSAEVTGVPSAVNAATNLDIDADGTADLTDAIMVILYLFGLENEGITNYILFSQQATRTDPQDVTAYIKTLITTGRIDIDADGTVDLTDIIMVILYLFGLENEGITNYILFSQQATRTDPQAVTDYIASLLP